MGNIVEMKRLSDEMPDFKTVNVGDTIKLRGGMVVEVLSIESSDSMTVKILKSGEWEKARDN